MKNRKLIILALLICLTGCGVKSDDDQINTSDIGTVENSNESISSESEVDSEDITESSNITVNTIENTVEIETTSSEESESVITTETEEDATAKSEKSAVYDEKLATIFESIVGEYDDDVQVEHMIDIETIDGSDEKYAISSIAFSTLYDTDVYEYNEKEIHFHLVKDWGYESGYVLYIYDDCLEIYAEDYETGEDGKLLSAATFSTKR